MTSAFSEGEGIAKPSHANRGRTTTSLCHGTCELAKARSTISPISFLRPWLNNVHWAFLLFYISIIVPAA